MFGKRKRHREERPHRHEADGADHEADHTADHAEPLSVPGYGPPPVTKPLGGGPQPSAYGVRPDVDPGEWADGADTR
jgi:hypothetical protein